MAAALAKLAVGVMLVLWHLGRGEARARLGAILPDRARWAIRTPQPPLAPALITSARPSVRIRIT